MTIKADKQPKKLVEIWGGFHNQKIPIRVRIPKDCKANHYDIRHAVSESVFKKIQNHLCGMESCICGGIERAEIEEV